MEPAESPARPTMRCPTCRAEQVWSDTCRRCKCDLSLLRRVFAAYQAARTRCLTELKVGQIEAALAAARECCQLNSRPESRRLLAVCSLLHGDWPAAVAVAKSAEAE